ncbi:hypothetical protein GGQ74_000853 [Desulfobaculum xiamenense]|uniref:Uncharacterized protein n=1 Tax=Desulfobaculum xiamenense TaxID=995050 RepID=A0A846QLX3_9BACT|nr:hypothetical protein [Desulfobaculum xiamenense]NJB67213.1 hypothetical protein [Desulfobaculum xiamenense]
MRLRSLVSRVLTFVDGNRFGVAGNPATFQLAEQASDVADGCGWRVEFEQVVFVGASVWDGEGVVPSEVRVSHSPLIGAAHEDKYVEVTDGFPGI